MIKFEERSDIAVNIFYYDEELKMFFPYYTSNRTKSTPLNLLLITKDEKSHYVYIKDINKLLSKQLRTKNKGGKHLCLACLNFFTSERVLNDHKQLCLAVNGTQATVYEEGIIRFKNFENIVRCPFRIYADTKCFTKNTILK